MKANIFDRIEWILKAARNVARCRETHSRLDEMKYNIYKEYAEPGYSTKNGAIVTGNWNKIDKYHPDSRTFTLIDNTPVRVCELLEKAGVDIEWSDEWSNCYNCNKLFRTSPDSYGWKRAFYQFEDGDCYCHECIKDDPSEYLETLEGNSRSCVTIDGLDLSEHGYLLAQEGFENGLYGGQSADPKKVADALQNLGINRFLFVLDDVGQFDIEFSVWVHEDEHHLLKGELKDTDGVDPAEMLKQALKNIPVAGDGGPIQYTSVDLSNGTAKTTQVSPEDFIKGNLPE